MTGTWIVLGAGIMAAFNPCGVAMLPGYIIRLLGGQERKLSDGLVAGVLMTLGFLLVFIVSGVLASLFATALGPVVSWIAFIVGILFSIAGILMFFGKSLWAFHIAGPKATNTESKGSFFVYGIAYALGSLGCTLPLFSLLVLSSFASQGFVGGITDFVLYALGMGFIVTVISLASTISQQLVSAWMRKAARWMGQLSAVITFATGVYLIFYWWPHLMIK